MKTNIPTLALAALASMFTLASGAPTSADSGLVTFSSSGNLTAQAVNDCGDSSFENQTSGDSPLVSDCWTLFNNIAGDGTWYTSGHAEHRTLAQYGSCNFGVQADPHLGTVFKVGNGDIRDLVRDSIRKFGGSGRVGARGWMGCQNEGIGSTRVLWGIF